MACAMVRFLPDPAVSWEMAVLPNQNLADLPVGKFYGYGVDAGMGCFLDARTVESLSEDDKESLHSRLIDEMNRNAGQWGELILDPETQVNLLGFSSGLGDGAYPSYWGLDAAGRLCCLVTDFGLLVEQVKGKATFRISEWLGRALEHPDLLRIGLKVRVLPDKRSHLRLRLEMLGDSCHALVASRGKTYDSNRLSYCVTGGVGIYDFMFDEPLDDEANITLEYDMGARAL